MTHRLLPLCLVAALCLGPAALPAAELELAGDLKAQAAKLVKADNPEYLAAAAKRVAITSFAVEFVSELRYTKQLSGLEAMIGADSDVTIKLVGASNEQFQALSDKFYMQTVELLKARGIDVVPQAELAALPEYAELAASGITPLPSEQDAKAGKGLFFSAAGLPLVLTDEAQFIQAFQMFSKPKQDNFLTFGSRFSGGFTAAKTQQLEEQIARKLNASALKVRLTVLGGQLTPDTSFWSSGKVTTRAAASFVDFVTRYALITPDGKRTRVSLNETVSTGDIGELVNTTSGGTKATDTAANVALVALNVAAFAARMGGTPVPGVGGFSSTSNYECRVQPESFANTLLSHHAVLVGLFGEKMQNPTTP